MVVNIHGRSKQSELSVPKGSHKRTRTLACAMHLCFFEFYRQVLPRGIPLSLRWGTGWSKSALFCMPEVLDGASRLFNSHRQCGKCVDSTSTS